jgi:hypothetical protein
MKIKSGWVRRNILSDKILILLLNCVGEITEDIKIDFGLFG